MVVKISISREQDVATAFTITNNLQSEPIVIHKFEKNTIEVLKNS